MSKAFVASGEHIALICGYDKNPAKALKKVTKLVKKIADNDPNVMLSGMNVYYDDEGNYNINAYLSWA